MHTLMHAKIHKTLQSSAKFLYVTEFNRSIGKYKKKTTTEQIECNDIFFVYILVVWIYILLCIIRLLIQHDYQGRVKDFFFI